MDRNPWSGCKSVENVFANGAKISYYCSVTIAQSLALPNLGRGGSRYRWCWTTIATSVDRGVANGRSPPPLERKVAKKS